MHDDTSTLTPAEVEALRGMVGRLGWVRASRAVGVSRHVVERAIGGLGIRRGSAALIRGALALGQHPTTERTP